jgi:hypothetical protein
MLKIELHRETPELGDFELKRRRRRGTTRATMQEGNFAILGHLGLGDAFVQKGLVRTIAESTNGETIFFAKKRYEKSILDLYDDVDVSIVFVEDDVDISPAFGSDGRMWQAVEGEGFSVVPLGVHTGSNAWRKHDKNWAKSYYRQLGVNPCDMHGKFGKMMRDEAANKAMHDRVVEKYGKRYAVVHDDESRNMGVEAGWLPEGLPVVHVDDPDIRSDRISDYLETIENAEEFVGIDSSFALVVDFCFPPGTGPKRRTVHTTPGRPESPDDFYRGISLVDHGFGAAPHAAPVAFTDGSFVDAFGKRGD